MEWWINQSVRNKSGTWELRAYPHFSGPLKPPYFAPTTATRGAIRFACREGRNVPKDCPPRTCVYSCKSKDAIFSPKKVCICGENQKLISAVFKKHHHQKRSFLVKLQWLCIRKKTCPWWTRVAPMSRAFSVALPTLTNALPARVRAFLAGLF